MPRPFVKTGIKGLDAILGGGIPRGNVVLVTGSPGTGKTIFGIEFIYRGISEFDEPGLIVTFESSTERLVEDAAGLGWNLGMLQEQRKLKILSTSRSVFREELQQADSLLLAEASDVGARRIFVDGLAGHALNGNGTPPRDTFHMFIERLDQEGLTAVFALDAPVDQAGKGVLPEEYIADTIISLRLERVGRAARRRLEIVKSRGHEYLMGVHSFRIVDRQGLEVYRRVEVPRVRSAPPPAQPMDVTRRVSTGVPGLDELLNGGYFVGSTTLVVGISGTGKSVMGLQYLADGARRGERGLMITLDEAFSQVVRNATTIGIDLQAELDRDLLRLWSETPEGLEIDAHFAAIEGLVQTFHPRRVLIDSLSSYAASLGSREAFRDFFGALATLLRAADITAVYNHENPELLGMATMVGEFRVSSLVDNIILMNWVELGDTFRHALTVAKARAMPTTRATHECEIVNGRGLAVLPREIPLAVPAMPFNAYYGLLSRAPERHLRPGTGSDGE